MASPRDISFGKIAVKNGFMNQKQVDECIDVLDRVNLATGVSGTVGPVKPFVTYSVDVHNDLLATEPKDFTVGVGYSINKNISGKVGYFSHENALDTRLNYYGFNLRYTF